MNILRTVILLLLTTACFSCGSGSQKPAPAAETADHAHEEETDLVSLSPEQIKAVHIQTSALEHKDLTTSIRVNGKLEVPNQNKAAVTSLYSGVLKTLDIHPGAHVIKGQVLATVANTDFINVEQELISVNARLKLARLEYQRQSELVAGNAAPMKNLQKAQADLSSLQGQQKALQQHLSALGIDAAAVGKGQITSALTVTAPISGTISDIHANIGSKVDPSAPIADIVNNSRLHLDLFVYEKDLPRVSMGQTIHFTLTNNPGHEYDAKIFSVGTAFADESKAIPVHAEVLGDKTGLIDGMGVTAIISIGTASRPAVPDEAIVSDKGRDYIFIRTDRQPDHADQDAAGHTSFQRIEVVKGTADLGYTEITPVTPLPAGVQIVTSGAFFIMASLTNKGEHEH